MKVPAVWDIGSNLEFVFRAAVIVDASKVAASNRFQKIRRQSTWLEKLD